MKKKNYVLAAIGLSVLTMAGCGNTQKAVEAPANTEEVINTEEVTTEDPGTDEALTPEDQSDIEEVTPESLINGLSEKEDTQNLNMQMFLKVDMDMTSDGNTYNIRMDMDVNEKTTEKYAHMVGSSTISVMEFSQDIPMDVWFDYDAQKLYAFNPEGEKWEASDMDEAQYRSQEPSNFSNMSPDFFSDLRLTEDKLDGYYIVTGSMDYNSMMDGMEDVSFMTDMTPLDENMENLKMDVTMKFDIESKDLKVMIFDLNPSGMTGFEDALIHTFQISAEFLEWDETTDLTPPAEVLDGTVK